MEGASDLDIIAAFHPDQYVHQNMKDIMTALLTTTLVLLD